MLQKMSIIRQDDSVRPTKALNNSSYNYMVVTKMGEYLHRRLPSHIEFLGKGVLKTR